MKKRMALFLLLTVLLALFAPAAFAQEAEAGMPYASGSAVPTEELPDNDELFAGYVEQAFFGRMQTFGTNARRYLNPQEQQVYDVLKRGIEQIAAAGGSAEIMVETETIEGLQFVLPEGEDIVSEYQRQVDLGKLMDALIYDCPYDLYWFDKTSGISFTPYGYTADGVVRMTKACYSFAVAQNYRQGQDIYAVSGEVALVQKAVRVAKAIVASNWHKDDYSKLQAYRKEVCRLADYNDDTIQIDYTENNDPWQLIWVFDENPYTRVVCEGYAKAFQYLCDLSEFHGAVCYTVTGYMGGIGHMWNIVTMADGGNYMADVTNTDAGAIGEGGGLFLSGAEGGTVETGYWFGDISYCYNSYTRELYPESVLKLSLNDYEYRSTCTKHMYGSYYDQGNGTKTRFCLYCGGHQTVYSSDKTGVTRIYGDDRYATAYAAAEELRDRLNVEKFENIIIANGENFADALAGSYLAAVKKAPILMTPPDGRDAQTVRAYVDAALAPGGQVYILGGPAAVSEEVDAALTGHRVWRLAGSDRFETNLLILQEAGVRAGDDILVCTGRNFPDSLSASAVGKPILLVDTGTNSLSQAQKSFLQTAHAGRLYIIGGTAVIPPALEELLQQYGTVERLAGADRYDTSVKVARKFFDAPDAAVLAYGQKFPDGLCGGPLAMSINAPLLLAESASGAPAAAYMGSRNITDGYVLGGPALIDDETVMNATLGR